MTGNGTAASPYLVGNAADLLSLDGKSGYAELTADIDLNPEGCTDSFGGITVGGELHLEGNGYSIKNMYQILTTAHPHGGLFQGTFSGSVRNLAIENAYISGTRTGEHHAGILADTLGVAEIVNVSVSGAINTPSVATGTYIGGMCAYIDKCDGDVSFSGCTVAVNICGGSYVGGFAGRVVSNAGRVISFENCVVSCRFYGVADCAGGFVGYEQNNSTSHGVSEYMGCSVNMYLRNPAAAVEVYGLCGGFFNSVADSACIVDIEAEGSFSGISWTPRLVTQSYVKGRVMGVESFSGIGGQADTEINHSYVAVVTDCASPCGISGRSTKISQSFFDSDLMPDAVDAENGATTAQLKDAAWLRNTGWAI